MFGRLLLLVTLIACAHCNAQKVSPQKLNKIISDFARDGYKLENKFEPDFSKPNPNPLSRFIPCYQGKNVIVVAVMAFKPGSLLFKVVLKGKEAPKTHELENLSTNEESVYYDYRALKFPTKFPQDPNCINIMLYDRSGATKPVYTLIFTKPNKENK
jgi:hypothetical protein